METLQVPIPVKVPFIMERLPKILLRKLGTRLVGKIKYDAVSSSCRVQDDQGWFAIDFTFRLENNVISVPKPIAVELLPQSEKLLAKEIERRMKGVNAAREKAVRKLKETSFIEDRKRYILDLKAAEIEYRKDADFISVLRKIGFAKTGDEKRSSKAVYSRRLATGERIIQIIYPQAPYTFVIPLEFEVLDEEVDHKSAAQVNPFWYVSQYVRRELLFEVMQEVGLRKFIRIERGFCFLRFELLTEQESYDVIMAVMRVWDTLHNTGAHVNETEQEVVANYQQVVRDTIDRVKEL